MKIHSLLRRLGAYTVSEDEIAEYDAARAAGLTTDEAPDKEVDGPRWTLHRILKEMGAYTVSYADIAAYEAEQRTRQEATEAQSGCAFTIFKALLATGVVCAFISILLPTMNKSREQASRVRCASNLRQIGIALQIYANLNKDELPDLLDRLVDPPAFTPQVLRCPRDDGQPSTTRPSNIPPPTTTYTSSYWYLGAGRRFSHLPPDFVLALDPLSNHADRSTNVLTADGQVNTIKGDEARKLFDELARGDNPPKHEKTP